MRNWACPMESDGSASTKRVYQLEQPSHGIDGQHRVTEAVVYCWLSTIRVGPAAQDVHRRFVVQPDRDALLTALEHLELLSMKRMVTAGDAYLGRCIAKVVLST